jgi:hypothetical protein
MSVIRDETIYHLDKITSKFFKYNDVADVVVVAVVVVVVFLLNTAICDNFNNVLFKQFFCHFSARFARMLLKELDIIKMNVTDYCD